MVEFKIQAQKSCMLVIDMMNVFISPGSSLEVPNGRKLIPKLKRLMDVCRDKGLPIIFFTHEYRRDGYDLGLHPNFHPEIKTRGILYEETADTDFYSELQPQKDDIIIVKRRFSAFVGTELDLILRSNEIDTLIIGGVVSNVCCESTARDARMRDYKVIFLSDGTAARGLPDMGWGGVSPEEVQRYVLINMAYYFAQVLSVEEVINRLAESQR